jgi:hypothetical protein
MVIICQKRRVSMDGRESLKANTMNFASGVKIYLTGNEISTEIGFKKLNAKHKHCLATMDCGYVLYL